MKKVIAPLQPSEQGQEVANLQLYLHSIITGGAWDLDQTDQDELLPRLGYEYGEMFYGEATSRLVQLFNIRARLGDFNHVNESTAYQLNKILAELILLGDEPLTYTV